MRDHLTRSLPSPAMVVAVTALFVALGGTGYAASTLVSHSTTAHAAKAKKPASDTKTDAKLVKKLAGGLSVKHAQTADTAIAANSANTAAHATNATNATNATVSANANNANNANNLGEQPASFYAGSAQPAFTLVTLNSGWSNFSGSYTPAGYMKDNLGFAHLEGAMHCQQGKAFTLPAGFRPALSTFMPIALSSGTTGSLEVFSDGSVYANMTSSVICGIDGATFRAGG